jgi:hypothetical protein
VDPGYRASNCVPNASADGFQSSTGYEGAVATLVWMELSSK